MQRKQTLIAALDRFIRQRPGLEYGNYGDPVTYRAEVRSIGKDLKHAQTLLSAVAWRDSITADSIIAASRSAFSGRLTITEPTPGKFSLSYCIGQYWPTEYRRAVCAVLSQTLLAHWRDDMSPDSFSVVCMGEDWREVPATSKTWTDKAQAEAYCATVAPTRHPRVVDLYRGQRAGDALRRIAREKLGRGVAHWFN